MWENQTDQIPGHYSCCCDVQRDGEISIQSWSCQFNFSTRQMGVSVTLRSNQESEADRPIEFGSSPASDGWPQLGIGLRAPGRLISSVCSAQTGTALFKSDSSEWKCHGMQEPPGHCDRVTVPSMWAGAPSLSQVSAWSWAPPRTSENALWRVAVRKACGPCMSGGLGPDVLGALQVAVPVGTGRRLAGLGHLRRKG